MKIRPKQIEIEALQWEDNLSEMKHFCGNHCRITYESCEIDDYYDLLLDDDIRDAKIHVPLHGYVLKIDEKFTYISASDFINYFERVVDSTNNINDEEFSV